jgi:proteasome lid subunit RPN8/RPN11
MNPDREDRVGAPRLLLAPGIREAMITHARRALPLEAVGMLGGSGDRATLVRELTSLGGARHFLVDPRSQYEGERALRSLGLSLLAIYHSHPGGGATLSDIDIAFAARLPHLQVVIALARPRDDGEELRAYRVSGTRVDEVPIVS